MNRLFSGSRFLGPIAAIERGLGRGIGRWAGIFLFFSVAAVVQTWPLARHPTDHIMDTPAQPGDPGILLWNLWWVKHALVDQPTNPFETDLLFFPQGADLHLHTLAFVNGVLSIPLQLATNNVILSWNLLSLTLLVFSGVGAYCLSFRVTRNHLPALVSGFIFALAPVILIRLQGPETGTALTMWPLPWFAFFLVRYRETGRLREAIAAGLAWALLTYNWQEFALDASGFLALFTAYWSIVYLLSRDWGSLLTLGRGFVVTFVVWFAVSAPLLIPSFLSVYGSDPSLRVNDEFYSSDLLTFVKPSPLWGPGTLPGTPYGAHLPVGSIENTAYLGIVPLLLAGLAFLAVRRTPHRVLLWGAVFLVFAGLSLGPYLYIDGTKSLSLFNFSFTVPLPYQLYEDLPVFSARRIPSRMVITGILGLSVLAAVGLDFLAAWSNGRWKRTGLLFAVVALSLVALEYWNPPVHLSRHVTPAVFDEIRNEPGDFTVLHAPLGRMDGWFVAGDVNGGWLATYYERLHGRPTFGGNLARARDLGWIMEQPGLHYLACRCPEPQTLFENDMKPEVVRPLFRKYKIKYVVLHRLGPWGQALSYFDENTFAAVDAYLRTIVGLIPIYADSTFTVYRNQEVGQEGAQEE